MENTAREDVQNTHLDELKQRLRMRWVKLDHVVIAAAIRQWCRRVKTGDGHLEHRL